MCQTSCFTITFLLSLLEIYATSDSSALKLEVLLTLQIITSILYPMIVRFLWHFSFALRMTTFHQRLWLYMKRESDKVIINMLINSGLACAWQGKQRSRLKLMINNLFEIYSLLNWKRQFKLLCPVNTSARNYSWTVIFFSSRAIVIQENVTCYISCFRLMKSWILFWFIATFLLSLKKYTITTSHFEFSLQEWSLLQYALTKSLKYLYIYNSTNHAAMICFLATSCPNPSIITYVYLISRTSVVRCQWCSPPMDDVGSFLMC